jgi:hypothetical protein
MAVVAALALLATLVVLSRDFGVTWDEKFQQKYGEQIWDYYHGRLARSTFDTDFGDQYLYSGLVEVISVSAQHVLPWDTYVVRHLVNAVFGWLGIVFCGLLAARAFGRPAGWLAAALLALAPRYIGDSMNNSKDLPLAALSTAALYYLSKIEWTPPHLSWKDAAKIATVVALAINVRPLGLMLLLYTVATIIGVAVARAFRSGEPENWRGMSQAALRSVVIAAVVIPASAVFWPWAQGQPLLRPLEGFLKSTHVTWAEGFDVLYDGTVFGSGSLPWHYAPYWLWMSVPPVILAGAALSWLVLRRSPRERVMWLGLVACVIVPLFGAIWRHATLYDGIRHLGFIVPIVAALSGAGWGAALCANRSVRWPAAIVLLIGITEPLAFQIRNHPNQIVYFSPLAGGPRAAFGRYEMDYWGNSVLQAVRWADNIAKNLHEPLVVTGNPDHLVQENAARFHSLWFAPRQAGTAQLDIRLLKGPPDAVRTFAARADILYKVTMADGTPLCVVLPGPAYQSIGHVEAQTDPSRGADNPTRGRVDDARHALLRSDGGI